MREAKSIAAGRRSRSDSRRPSFPADQWINQAKTGTKIWVKVAMGIAYFFCVSIAALFLAIYYVAFWNGGWQSSNSTNATNEAPALGGMECKQPARNLQP